MNSPYLNLSCRDLRTALEDMEAGTDSRILLWDDPEPVVRCKRDGCGLPLRTSHEHHYRMCWHCLRDEA